MSRSSPITASRNLFAGTDKAIVWSIVDENNEPIDASGFAIEFRLQSSADDGETWSDEFTKDTAGGGVHQGDDTDQVQVDILETDTQNFDLSLRYQYRLIRTDPGSVDVLAYGEIVFRSL